MDREVKVGVERLGLGERVVAARKRRRISQGVAAAEIGVCRKTIARIERGTYVPSAETREKVLAWLAAQEAAAAAEWAAEEERLAAEERAAAEREGGALPFVRLPDRDGGFAAPVVGKLVLRRKVARAFRSRPRVGFRPRGRPPLKKRRR